MEIERIIFNKLEQQLKQKEILALVGARQVGKTTLLKELYEKVKEDALFLTFEDIETLQVFETNIKLFIERFVKPYKYLFIDEFQYAKSGGKSLKFIYDTENIKICISGSSNPELAIHSLQFLVGRVSIYEIFPLSFKEFVNYKDKSLNILLEKQRKQNEINALKNLFQEFLQYGGYPEIVKETNVEEKQKKIKNIVNTYFLKEIKDVLEYKNLFEYENTLKKLAIQDGGILNKNSFSLDLGIKIRKFNEILSVLNNTYIVSQMQPFFRNSSKSLIKSPKTYFIDLGFKNSLIGNFNQLELRADKGEIYENFIFNEFRKLDLKPQFWNLLNRYEIDFIIEKNGEIIGIECKSILRNSSITKSISKFIELENPNKIICFNENIDKSLNNKTEIVFTNYLNLFSLLE